MGQHKYNPTAIAAKNGELPTRQRDFPKGKETFQKGKRLSKRERERDLMRMIYEKTGIGRIERSLGINSFEEAEMMADLVRRW